MPIQSSLTELPSPPVGKQGWPWVPADVEPGALNNSVDWPRITIVTPSFNQGRFIEATIRSILLQGYPNLEYIIVDGGSTDGTLDIVRRYEPWITYWVSEPDRGMYDAINKGFAKSTGEIMGWSPTGDLYMPRALQTVGNVFEQLTQVEWLTSLYKTKCDESGRDTYCYRVKGYNRRAFFKGQNFPNGSRYAKYTVQQQSTFWRRRLWEKAGGQMDDSLKGAGDFELWCRFYQHEELYAVDQPIGIFRTHAGQTSVRANRMMLEEQSRAFERAGGHLMGRVEGMFRRYILVRRPFNLLTALPLFGFPSLIIHYPSNGGVPEIEVRRFG